MEQLQETMASVSKLPRAEKRHRSDIHCTTLLIHAFSKGFYKLWRAEGHKYVNAEVLPADGAALEDDHFGWQSDNLMAGSDPGEMAD